MLPQVEALIIKMQEMNFFLVAKVLYHLWNPCQHKVLLCNFWKHSDCWMGCREWVFLQADNLLREEAREYLLLRSQFGIAESGKTYVAHLHILNKSPWSQRLRYFGDSFYLPSYIAHLKAWENKYYGVTNYFIGLLYIFSFFHYSSVCSKASVFFSWLILCSWFVQILSLYELKVYIFGLQPVWSPGWVCSFSLWGFVLLYRLVVDLLSRHSSDPLTANRFVVSCPLLHCTLN